MSYVDKNLMQGEEVIYRAKIHWYIFLPAIIFFVFGIFLFSKNTDGGGAIFGLISILISIYLSIKAAISRASTELAVTSKRVIAKFGFIRRNTIELNHSKVESFHVDQSILGRIFDFGTIVINGTGGGKTPIPNIDAPLVFRRNAMESIDVGQSN